ncbi:MAG: transposase [Candidatus Rokubacteria bacterium]|nr:transposase [Candidatus Rokubacteria bacterium]
MNFFAHVRSPEISRKTGYKWVERYEAGGVRSLFDRSRAPHSHPHAVAAAVVDAVIALRRRHPHWGPRKLLAILRRRVPDRPWPVATTVGTILRRRGLVRPRCRRRYSAPYAERLREYAAPNAIWCADFKGHFPVGDRRCHPLTIMDGFSRFLLRCQALKRPLFAPTRSVFESAFGEFGFPHTMRTLQQRPSVTHVRGLRCYVCRRPFRGRRTVEMRWGETRTCATERCDCIRTHTVGTVGRCEGAVRYSAHAEARNCCGHTRATQAVGMRLVVVWRSRACLRAA